MTVKEIRTLVKYNCFNKMLWDRWSGKLGESSLNGYLNNSVWNKWAFLTITLILSIIGLSLRTVGKNSENDFTGFCLCVLSLILFMCWYTFHWCRLGNDIETVGIALDKDASFVISTPIGQLEEMVAYRLCVQARIVLLMEESFGTGDSPQARSAVKDFRRLHKIYRRFGLCEEKWDTYFKPVEK